MKTYRVVCTAGHVYDVAVWLTDGEGWLARMTNNPIASGDDERAAVVMACVDHINVAEVRAPGEPSTAEQLAAAERALASIRDAVELPDTATLDEIVAGVEEQASGLAGWEATQ